MCQEAIHSDFGKRSFQGWIPFNPGEVKQVIEENLAWMTKPIDITDATYFSCWPGMVIVEASNDGSVIIDR